MTEQAKTQELLAELASLRARYGTRTFRKALAELVRDSAPDAVAESITRGLEAIGSRPAISQGAAMGNTHGRSEVQRFLDALEPPESQKSIALRDFAGSLVEGTRFRTLAGLRDFARRLGLKGRVLHDRREVLLLAVLRQVAAIEDGAVERIIAGENGMAGGSDLRNWAEIIVKTPTTD